MTKVRWEAPATVHLLGQGGAGEEVPLHAQGHQFAPLGQFGQDGRPLFLQGPVDLGLAGVLRQADLWQFRHGEFAKGGQPLLVFLTSCCKVLFL